MKVTKKLDDLSNIKVVAEKSRENIVITKEEQLKYIDEEFDKVILKLNARRAFLKKNYTDICQEELGSIDTEINKIEPQINSLKKDSAELDKYQEKLGNKNEFCWEIAKTKIVQGDALQKELNEIEDTISKNAKSTYAVTPNLTLPRAIFDPTLYKGISAMGTTTKSNISLSLIIVRFKKFENLLFWRKIKNSHLFNWEGWMEISKFSLCKYNRVQLL
jgi:hypothetical protein